MAEEKKIIMIWNKNNNNNNIIFNEKSFFVLSQRKAHDVAKHGIVVVNVCTLLYETTVHGCFFLIKTL